MLGSQEISEKVAQDPAHVAVGALQVLQHYAFYFIFFLWTHIFVNSILEKKKSEFLISVKV